MIRGPTTLPILVSQAASPDLARRVEPEGGRAVESSENATHAWRALMAAQCGGQEPRLSGARLFGLDNATVARLVQALPHAPRCARFAAWAGPAPEPEPLVRRMPCCAISLSKTLRVSAGCSAPRC